MKTHRVSPSLAFSLAAVIAAMPVARCAAQLAGAVDDNFHPPANLGTVFSLAVQPDGKLVVGGGSGSFGIPPVTFTRLLPDGSVDPDFHPGVGPNRMVQRVVLLADGRMLVGGDFTVYDQVPQASLVRINPDGTVDPAFPNIGLDGLVNNIVLLKDGKFIITGNFNHVQNTPRNHIARLLADGSLDVGFDPGALVASFGAYSPSFYAVAEQEGGRILVGGDFQSVQFDLFFYLARFNPDGSFDPTFQPPALLLPVFSLAFQSTGRLLVGGEFWSPRVNLLRLNPVDGALDESFDAEIEEVGSDPIVAALLVQPDDRILVGGQNIRRIGELERRRIGRLHPDGTGDTSFDPGTGAEFGWIKDLALSADGSIYVGGGFTEFNGLAVPGLVRLQNDGFTPRVQFTAASYAGLENDAAGIVMAIRRSGPVASPLRVSFETQPGAAAPGEDYKPGVGTVTLEAGEVTKSFIIEVRNDRKAEANESFSVRLRRVGDHEVEIGPLHTAVLTIVDDDTP